MSLRGSVSDRSNLRLKGKNIFLNIFVKEYVRSVLPEIASLASPPIGGSAELAMTTQNNLSV